MEGQPQPLAHVQEIPLLSSIREAAKLLGLESDETMYKLLRNGELSSVLIGGRRRITGESIAKLLRASLQQEYQASRQSPNPAARKNAAGGKIAKVA
jgi:excisionase family DNA binding protein